MGVFGAEVGFAFFGDEAFEGGFAIDECGYDVAVSGLFFLEDDGVAAADVGVDHGFAADFECEGVVFAGGAEGCDVYGDLTFGFLGLCF